MGSGGTERAFNERSQAERTVRLFSEFKYSYTASPAKGKSHYQLDLLGRISRPSPPWPTEVLLTFGEREAQAIVDQLASQGVRAEEGVAGTTMEGVGEEAQYGYCVSCGKANVSYEDRRYECPDGHLNRTRAVPVPSAELKDETKGLLHSDSEIRGLWDNLNRTNTQMLTIMERQAEDRRKIAKCESEIRSISAVLSRFTLRLEALEANPKDTRTESAVKGALDRVRLLERKMIECEVAESANQAIIARSHEHTNMLAEVRERLDTLEGEQDVILDRPGP